MPRRINRRQFVRNATALAGAGLWLSSQSERSLGYLPNERMNVACIGVGGKGSSDTDGAAKYGQVVAYMKTNVPLFGASYWRNGLITAITFAFFAASAIAEDKTDVTTVVNSAVKDNKLSIAASNERFGDTAPGVPKKLTVEYKIGDEKLRAEASENGTIDIAAPEDQKLVITKAVYGPADGSKPVSLENAAEVLDTLPGFTIEHMLTADADKNGSWICMAKDPKGRLLLGGQGKQPITRVTLENGKVAKQEILNIPVSETMGMLFVGDALYINGSGSRGFALYRCRDTKGDDSYDDVEFLREWQGGGGEHGSHGLVRGPDNML